MLPFHGHVSAFAVDPIEKKPLYHFAPGATIASVGLFGCNLSCDFCQNYAISQALPPGSTRVTPAELVSRALDVDSIGLAFTYNEPTVHFEFVAECAALAHHSALANVLVTNGSLRREPAEELLELMDAVNVDIKGFTKAHYRSLGGSLSTVCDFVQIAGSLTHLEVTTLLIPGFNDSDAEVREIAAFVATISPDVPLHLSAYRPAYKRTVARTPISTIERALRIASEHLRYVYTGNTGAHNVTHCRHCGAPLVTRRGYQIDRTGLQGTTCQGCGARSPFTEWPVDTSP